MQLIFLKYQESLENERVPFVCQPFCLLNSFHFGNGTRANFIPNLRNGRANELLNYSAGEVEMRMTEELATTSSRRRISV